MDRADQARPDLTRGLGPARPDPRPDLFNAAHSREDIEKNITPSILNTFNATLLNGRSPWLPGIKGKKLFFVFIYSGIAVLFRDTDLIYPWTV